MITTPLYQPPQADLWQGRTDSLSNERFFQNVQLIDLRYEKIPSEQPVVLLGFCSDTGIKRNNGRVGAKEGPQALRKELAKLAYHSSSSFIDIGNIRCENEDLELAQLEFANLIRYVHEHRGMTVAFGGGHEIAWPHFLGLNGVYPSIGIINFDAHFDLRPYTTNFATSGTPFTQISHHCQQQQYPFNYCCLGIQAHANTSSLFKTAENCKVQFLTAEQLQDNTFAENAAFLNHFIAKQEVIYLTICMDVFTQSVAPGVSAPQPLGLLPSPTLKLLKYILQSGKVKGLDIAELSPSLDIEFKTVRLAAALIAELFAFC